MEQLAFWANERLPKKERPRRKARRLYAFSDNSPQARLCDRGAEALSEAEILALVLGGRPEEAQVLLSRWSLSRLLRAGIAELSEVPGIGPARAVRVKAALELGRRLLLSSGERLYFQSPTDVADFLRLEMGYLEQEQVRVLLLDARHRLIRQVLVYQGNVGSATVRVGELFREAVRENAAAIIVVHNHPSGDPSPSPEDVALTREIVEAGKLLNIEVLDHLVVGRQGYVSLRERRMGF